MFKHDTKILMYDGKIKSIDKIKINDKIMGDDSTSRTVINIYNSEQRGYEIIPIKGDTITVSEKQPLILVHMNNNQNKIITIEDYFLQNISFHNCYKLYKIYCEFESKILPIEPYFVGIYLGNGCKSTSNITTNINDKIVIDYINDYCQSLGYKTRTENMLEKRNSNCMQQYINDNHARFSFRKFIKTLLTDNNERFIPDDYLINSKNNRLQLLAGILDSDGYYDIKGNGFDIICKDACFRNQIVFLAQSLGIRATKTDKLCSIKSLNFSNMYYRCHLSGYINIIPNKLSRKQARNHLQIKNPLRTGFKIKEINKDNFYHIELDNNKLFLLDDFTVAHDSTILGD